MNRSIVGRLIAKDLYFYRWLVVAALVAGVASLVLSRFVAGDNVSSGPNLGILMYITSIVAFAVTVPMVGILKERQDKSQLFVLSLPVSAAQYTLAKVLAALLAFLMPWLAFTAGVVVLTLLSQGPHGVIPSFVLMMAFFLCTFCMLLALVVATMSELWAVTGILLTNVVVTVYLTKVASHPTVIGGRGDAVATWSPTILAILGVETALILLALGLAVYLPSRKKDLV